MIMLHAVVPGLWRIPLGMVNAYLIEHAHGPILIDCGSPGDEQRIVAALSMRNITLAQLQLCVGTHLHYDHVGSLAALQALGAPVAVMHPADARATAQGMLMRRPFQLTPPLHLLQRRFDAQPDQHTTYAPAQVSPEAQHGAYVTRDLEVIHTPGHTAGHISLLWHAHGGVLIAGDACTRIGGMLWYAVGHEDVTQAARSRRKLAEYTFASMVVGHGRPLIGGAQRAVARRFAPDTTHERTAQ